MLSKTQRRQCLSFAENVAALSLVRKAPTTPHDNYWSLNEDPTRILSPEHELLLTRALAFLCGISNDASHVIATCVEETLDRKAIRVVVAINKERPTCGDAILARIKEGVEEVFSHLSRVNKVEYGLLEDRVIESIAHMCKHRIFARVRSQRRDAEYTKKDKPFFGLLVQKTIDAVRKHGNRMRSKSEVEAFVKGTQNLLSRLAVLESCQEKDVLANIKGVLYATRRLNRTTDLEDILSGINPRDLDQSTKTAFITRVEKLAHYPECSAYLLQLARDQGLFKGAEVVTVSLDPQLFARDTLIPPECCLARCLQRCENGASFIYGAKNISNKLKDLRVSDTTFLPIVHQVLREARVHAEIQIVCYYELHPNARKPRVICSSKDACYLCNLFVKLHGTFHIPRTHGNLYTGWRILPVPALNRVQAKLNRALEVRMREIIGEVMTAETPTLMLSPNENESTVFRFPTAVSPYLAAPAPPPTLAEASGSRALDSRNMSRAQQSPRGSEAVEQHAEDPPGPTTGAPGSVSPKLNDLTGTQPASIGDRAATPEPPARSRQEDSGTDTVSPSSRGERAPEVPCIARVSSAVATSSSKHSSLANKADISHQAEPACQLEPEKASKSVLELTPGSKHEPGPVPRSIPEPEPMPEVALDTQPEWVPEREPAQEPEPQWEPNPLQVPDSSFDPNSQTSFSPNPERKPEPIPDQVPCVTATISSASSATPPKPQPNSVSEPEPVPNTCSGSRSIRRHPPKQPPKRLTLTRGKPIYLRLDIAGPLPPLTAGPITIHPEFIRSLATSRSVEAQIQWLSRRRAAAFYVARPRGFVDLDLLQEGVDVDGRSAECVYLAYRGEVVMVDVARGPA